MAKFVGDFETRIQGIPCQIFVDSYEKTKGSYRYDAPSSLDFYGGTECSFTVLDSRGYVANWLQRKMTDSDEQKILDQIEEFYDRY
jgi:hypothetical protein